MAKSPKSKPAVAPAPAATVSSAGMLPDGLEALMTTASHAAIAVARANAAVTEAQPGDAEAKAAFDGAAELLEKALGEIEAWFAQHVSERLAAADSEADRQLEEKREKLRQALDELGKDGETQLQAKRDELHASLAALETATISADLAATEGEANTGAFLRNAGNVITVIGPARGLRRAGYHFDANPAVIEVTEEQRALIAADPLLSVTEGATRGGMVRSFSSRARSITDFEFDDDDQVEVKVLGTASGRRRAGFDFGAEERVVRVTREQLTELLGDAELAVNAAA